MEDSVNSQRSKVLGDIRSALQSNSQDTVAQIEAEYCRTIASATPRPVVDGILVDRFIQKHEAVKGTAKIVKSNSQVPSAVQDFLSDFNLPTEMVMSKTQYLANFDWPPDWKISTRSAQKTDVVAITGAMCAIAESGTLVVASSPKVMSSHLYLPENHIAIFNIGQVVRHLEDALNLLTKEVFSESRGIHMITGPSKTADVEQTIQYGAHGPRRLHAIIVDSKG